MSKTSEKIRFIDYQLPNLLDGSYKVGLSHNFCIQESGKEVGSLSSSSSQSFVVSGPRFVVQPGKVKSVFPPKNGAGVYGNVLPQMLLDTLTLPWQRLPEDSESQPSGTLRYPWLALLVFDESEAPATSIVTASSLENATTESPFWPGIQLDASESGTETVLVIDVEYHTLMNVLPEYDDLPYLVHTRESISSDGDVSKFSAIVANRLPQASGKTVMHLVSLEGRFSEQESSFSFNSEGAKNGDLIRLVSLCHWSFSSISDNHNFQQLFKGLNMSPSTVQLPSLNNGNVDSFLLSGKVPLPHGFRTGDKSVSWYRGPLIPFQNQKQLSLPVTSGDSLLEFYSEVGMFDVSYAAAWELGRLLMLRNKRVSTAWYQWKQKNVQLAAKAEQDLASPHLQMNGGIESTDDQPPDLPDVVNNFFTDLTLLKHIPFYYLIPDENLLPIESIRFFQLDPFWLECLLDGAYSIGRIDGQAEESPSSAKAQGNFSGFLLRSSAVSDFPHLEVNGFNAEQASVTPAVVMENSLKPVRMEKLSPNVLLCLFDDIIAAVDIHQKAEVLHFGFDSNEKEPPVYSKKLRNGKAVSPIPCNKAGASNRVLDVSSLANSIGSVLEKKITASEFALQMIEGVENVRFNIKFQNGG